MVEFALVFPVFLLIVFFIIDCGWIIYQKASFDYGYTHASWNIDAGVLLDTGDYEREGNLDEETDWAAGYGSLEKAMEESIRDSALIGFRPEELRIRILSAHIENDRETEMSVPGPNPENPEEHKFENDEIKSFLTTRRMYVEAEVTCTFRALTPLGQSFFGENMFQRKIFGKGVRETRILKYDRVVGKQIRNAGTFDYEREKTDRDQDNDL